MNLRAILLSACVLAVGAPAAADIIPVQSYDAPNGSGQAHGGSYNYWDKAYGGGSHAIDGEALTGGTGDLTDGIAASSLWFNVENTAGTGPYVGWLANVTANPLLTFHFGGAPVIDTIAIHLDNSNVGGVLAPSAIWVDGAAVSFSTIPVGTSGWVNASGLNLTGDSHTIQFFYSQSWIFVSEVEFRGAFGAIPEPATWALMIGGFGLAGAGLRRRSTIAMA